MSVQEGVKDGLEKEGVGNTADDFEEGVGDQHIGL